ncbi:MAG: dephospho-CoA kinase [Anaerolineae bacterium]|nr:dephospho-CoA kinase [Anaerolineae bacterium]
MSRFPDKYVIGLTGNIAVGKSLVRQMGQHLGAYPIDADALVHQAMAPGAPAYKPIVDMFGQFILNPDKSINRTVLGQIVFGNPVALQRLESVTHPVVRQAISALIQRAKQKVIIVEAIKLLEGELINVVDEVWVVNAKAETQYRRLLSKRGMTPDEAKKRILAQNAQTDKLKQANVVIENDGDVEQTWKQVQVAWNNIVNRFLNKVSTQSMPVVAVTHTSDTSQVVKQGPPPPSAPNAPAAPAAQPVQQAPTMAAAAAAPAPSTTVAPTAPVGQPAASHNVHVRRGMPGNAEKIAAFITAHAGRNTTRMDIMLSFGQKSYLIAQDSDEQIVGLMGWQVENLITRCDELVMRPGAPIKAVVDSFIASVEEFSRELESEVCYIFLPLSTTRDIAEAFKANSYMPVAINQIEVLAWREAVMDATNNGLAILEKRLRKDRILTPI